MAHAPSHRAAGADLEARIERLEDRQEILDLAAQFSDAVNRVDLNAFQELWSLDGVWTIGPPVDQVFTGRDAIVEACRSLLEGSWEFFVQSTSSHVIEINGTSATARFYVTETARAKSGAGDFNLSMYADELVKQDGRWRFKSRTYNVLYLDETPPVGAAFQHGRDEAHEGQATGGSA